MKKIITVGLVVAVIVSGYIIFKNKDVITVSDPKVDDVAQSEVKIENWSTYTNSEYGLSMSYPAEFTIEEQTGYPKYVDFNSLLVKLGSSFQLVVYNTKMSPGIISLDTIPRLMTSGVDSEILSTTSITNANSVSLQVFKGVQYSYRNGIIDRKRGGDQLSIVFMNGQNAYTINWDCWSNRSCFNDEIITKIVDSIKFSK